MKKKKQGGKVIIELPRTPANAWLFEPIQDESRMISLIQYDEFENGMGFPSLKDSFNTDKYENQEKIIEYMKKGKIRMVLVNHDVDIVTGEAISNEK